MTEEKDLIDTFDSPVIEQVDPPEEQKEEVTTPVINDDDSDEQYSERVRKRINKEVFKRKSAEERNVRLEADIAALRADIESVRLRNATVDAQAVEGALQGQLESARQRLRQAIEVGDVNAQSAVTEEIADLKAQEREWKANKERRVPETPTPAPNTYTPPPGSPVAKWLEKNPWYTGKGTRMERMAFEVERQLQEEGYAPEEPDLYLELNKRLRSAMPSFSDQIQDIESTKKPTRHGGGPPSGTSSSSGPTTTPPPRRRAFTSEDLREMQSFQMKDTIENRKIWLLMHPSSPTE